MNNKITFNDIKNNEIINTYLKRGDFILESMGFTEHCNAHCAKVAEVAGDILLRLGYSGKDIELAKIAGYMHDIGNSINRTVHAHNRGQMAFMLLTQMGMDCKDVAVIASVIGQHDEKTGTAIDPISAAIILADKTDVRRNRVREKSKSNFDMHDRVNYAVTKSNLIVNPKDKIILLELLLFIK